MARASRLRRTVVVGALLALAASTSGRTQTPQDTDSNLAPEMVLQFGHAGAITKLVVSADGQRVMSIGGDFMVRLWDLPSGQLLRAMPEDPGESFRTAFFERGERPLVVALSRNEVRIRDLASGRSIASWPRATRAIPLFSDVALTANGEALALRDPYYGAPVTLYSTTTGAALATFDRPDVIGATCLGVSADARLLAHSERHRTGVTDVWDVRAGRRLSEIPDAPFEAASGIAACPVFTSDGTRLFTTGRGGTVAIWDARNGVLQKRFSSSTPAGTGSKSSQCDRSCLSALAVSSDGRWLATGAEDSTISIWDAAAGREVRRSSQAQGVVYAIAIGPDGKWVAFGGDNYDITVLDVASGQRRVLASHPDLVQAVACSAQGNSCAFGTFDKRIRLWNLTTGRESILSGHASQVNAVAFSADGRWLVSGSGDRTVKIWNATTGAEVRTLTGHLRAVTAVAVSPDGRTVASGSVGGDVKIWELSSAKELSTLTRITGTGPTGRSDDLRVVRVHFNPNGRELIALYWSGLATVFDLSSPVRRRTLPIEGSLAATVSPDGRWIATTSTSGGVAVWNAADGTLVHRVTHGSAFVQTAAFSTDGRSLATGSTDRTIRLWDTKTWASSVLGGHQGFVKSVAFGPDERRIISGGGDGTVRIWDVASKRQMAIVTSQKGGQPSVIVSPTGLFDGTAESMQQVAWRAPDTLEVAPLDAFFTDFFKPGLFADLMAGADPAAPVEFAAIVQVPGLRTMLAQKQAHIETRNGRAVVCFAEPPRVAADVPVTERQLRPRVRRGFRIDPGDRTCPYQKELAESGPNAAALAARLAQWKPDRVATVWDGKRSTDAASSTLHVFVAGIGDYPSGSGFDHLPYAAPSARAIESFFRQQGQAQSPFAAVRVWDGLYDASATRDGLLQRLAEMARSIPENDTVLLYLAGHGVVSSGQEMFYFVPFDGRERDLRATGLNTAMLADGIRSLNARRIVLFIDACQSGGAVEPLAQIAAVKAQVEALRAQGEPKGAGHEHGVGVHLIAATLPLSYAVQIAQNQSALAATVLAALQQGQEITVGQVASYLKDHLADASAGVAAGFRQVPFIDSVGLDFPIARSAR